MEKRIYNSMLLLIIITMVFSSFLITGVIYQEFHNRLKFEIRNEALFISTGYNFSGEDYFTEVVKQSSTGRITWVASDGTVLYDSVSDAGTMVNHLDRPEIADAVKFGYGEAVHASETLGMQTFYYAVRVKDGTVVRVSIATNDALRSLINFIPYNLLILVPVIILALILANLLTKKIIVPINNLNLENPLSNDVYDELSPLLSRMSKQNDQIESQFTLMQEKQHEFNTITENISEGIIVLNHQGQVLSINKSAAEIFGVSSTYNINKHILTLNRSLALQKAVRTAMEGNNYEDVFSKGKKTYQLLASPVIAEDPVKGIVLLVLDITERQNAEKMRREFSANVSHELKTPLTTISGYAELLKNGMVKKDDVAEFSGRIFDEARHLIGLVDDIIRISRLDEKNIKLSFESIDLLEMARDVVSRLTPTAQKKSVTLSVKGDQAVLSGVKQILDEMVYNLVDNAIKYNVDHGSVDVNINNTSEHIILSVKDNGVGIPKEHQGRVFERFYRIDKSHSKDTGGTGLGLSIVKHSAEFHNAKIELQSEPDKGTIISVIFNKNN